MNNSGEISYWGGAKIAGFFALLLIGVILTSDDRVPYPAALIPLVIAMGLLFAYLPLDKSHRRVSGVLTGLALSVAVIAPQLVARWTDGSVFAVVSVSVAALLALWYVLEGKRRTTRTRV